MACFLRYTLVALLVLVITRPSHCLTKPTSVKLVHNGYTGVVVAIHHEEPESRELIDELKAAFTGASSYMYRATKQRAYFEEVMILIPDTWQDKLEYQSPKNATFEGADVIVAPRNPRFAPSDSLPPYPHTKHYEGCGKQAVHIHLTSDFMLNDNTEQFFGDKGRILVHEWAHYRWGLFDENQDPVSDPNSESFYYSVESDTWEPARCPRGYDQVPLAFDSGKYRPCNGDRVVGYEKGCVSIPKRSQGKISSSIMSGYTIIDEIIDFCDVNDHNKEAPHKHHKVCGTKSNWEILGNHEDFKDSNPPRKVADTTPTFTLARSQPIRVVLVSDSSGSMSGANRIKKLSSASQDFLLNIAVDGSYIGLVDFDSEGRVLSHLTRIDSFEERSRLAGLIVTVADGGTCIARGLEAALQILSADGQPPAGGLILLMTDGEDGCDDADETERMRRRVVEENVVVDSLTISTTADPKLMNLSVATGGRSYHQSDDEGSTGLHDAFVGTMTSGVKIRNRRVEIYRESSSYAPDEMKSISVFIDETVGKGTVFEFSYLVDYSSPVLSVEVKTPSGVTYGSDYSDYNVDDTFKEVSVKFPAAEPGAWTFTVTNLYNLDLDIWSKVYTYPSQDNSDPITATSKLSGSMIDFANGEPLTAFAEVVKGFYPVIRATVIALIERPPDASGVSYPPVEMELYDNGAGADITKDDGIYSRYFTNFTGIGFYGIRMNIESTEDTVILDGSVRQPSSYAQAFVDPDDLLAGNIPTIDGEPILLPGMPVPELQGSPAPQFTRGISGGSNQVTETPPNWQPGDDVFAPNKITDLRVTSAFYQNRTVILEFTAPGDDLDTGGASYYVIRMGTSAAELQANYNSSTQVDDDTILMGNTSSPGLFGDHQLFILTVPMPEGRAVVSYTFAMHAVDEEDNQGEMSNIAHATLRKYIPSAPKNPVAQNPVALWVILGLAVAVLLAAFLALAAHHSLNLGK